MGWIDRHLLRFNIRVEPSLSHVGVGVWTIAGIRGKKWRYRPWTGYEGDLGLDKLMGFYHLSLCSLTFVPHSREQITQIKSFVHMGEGKVPIPEAVHSFPEK